MYCLGITMNATENANVTENEKVPAEDIQNVNENLNAKENVSAIVVMKEPILRIVPDTNKTSATNLQNRKRKIYLPQPALYHDNLSQLKEQKIQN